MRTLNYNHLRYFWAVAHDGNLTRTAARLNLSQSALSVQIRKLEDRLGHSLFEREGRQLRLTEAGRMALDHADAIFAVGDQLLGTLDGSDLVTPVLRVGARATLSRNFQIGFLRRLLGRTDIELSLRSGSPAELLRAMETLSLDVVLLNQPPGSETAARFLSHRLAEQQVSLIGTPDRLSGDRSLDRLLREQPVVAPTAESTIRTGFDALAHRLGVRPRVVAEADDMAMLRLLACEDVGLAVLPPVVVRDELGTGVLLEAQGLPGVVESFYAITLDRRFPNPLLKELLGERGHMVLEWQD